MLQEAKFFIAASKFAKKKTILRVHGVITVGAVTLQKKLDRLFQPITHLRYIAFTMSSFLARLYNVLSCYLENSCIASSVARGGRGGL